MLLGTLGVHVSFPHSFQRRVRRERRKDRGTKCFPWKQGRLCRKSGRAGTYRRKVNAYMGPMETEAGWPACLLQGNGGQHPPPLGSEVLSIHSLPQLISELPIPCWVLTAPSSGRVCFAPKCILRGFF